MINQRELGKDTYSYNNALRSVLREDPDVCLIGEMRDMETIEATLDAVAAHAADSLEAVLQADRAARHDAGERIATL